MTDLWQGSGAVPGPYKDAHSTRSKAYGIPTMLRFLLNYVTHFPLIWHRAHPIQLYCNNNGILQQLHPPNTKLPPKSTILDDYDVVAEIQSTIRALMPLKLNFTILKDIKTIKWPPKIYHFRLNSTLNVTAELTENYHNSRTTVYLHHIQHFQWRIHT